LAGLGELLIEPRHDPDKRLAHVSDSGVGGMKREQHVATEKWGQVEAALSSLVTNTPKGRVSELLGKRLRRTKGGHSENAKGIEFRRSLGAFPTHEYSTRRVEQGGFLSS